jgi:hypothetical protein
MEFDSLTLERKIEACTTFRDYCTLRQGNQCPGTVANARIFGIEEAVKFIMPRGVLAEITRAIADILIMAEKLGLDQRQWQTNVFAPTGAHKGDCLLRVRAWEKAAIELFERELQPPLLLARGLDCLDEYFQRTRGPDWKEAARERMSEPSRPYTVVARRAG